MKKICGWLKAVLLVQLCLVVSLSMARRQYWEQIRQTGPKSRVPDWFQAPARARSGQAHAHVHIQPGPYSEKLDHGNELMMAKSGQTTEQTSSVTSNILGPPHSGESIRLRGNSSYYNAGMVEVYRNGRWGIICDDYWSKRDANVACRQLGFKKGAVRYTSESQFGYGVWSSSDFLMDNMGCVGIEDTLHSCNYLETNDCEITEIAGAVCVENDGCEAGWTAGAADSCYRLYRGTMNRRSARDMCRQDGGHLVQINSDAENNFLSTLLLRFMPDQATVHTDGLRSGGVWVWESDNSVIGITKWFPGWPFTREMQQPTGGRNERCLALQSRFIQKQGGKSEFHNADYYFWNDVPCDLTSSFVCEKRHPNKTQPDCYVANGETYRGHASFSDQGSPCLKWTDSSLINPTMFPMAGLGDHNYCRNPDGDNRPWCWVDIFENRYGFCGGIEQCANISQSADMVQATELPQTTTTSSVPECPENKFYCSIENKCISSSWRCDADNDCEGNEDETNCDYKLELFERYPSRRMIDKHEKEKYIHASTSETCARLCVKAQNFVCRSFWHSTDRKECSLSDVNINRVGRPASNRNWNYYELISHSIDCSGGFLCDNGKCLSDSADKCNWRDDCGDFSDEEGCEVSLSAPTEVRLVGGDELKGRVEILYHGEWGIICDDNWDLDDANVVCRMLGYRSAERVSTQEEFGEGEGKFILDEVACAGTELSIVNCSHDPWGQHDCQPYEAAGVECKTKVKPQACATAEFRCPNGICKPASFICDGDDDCGNMADEKDCELVVELVGGSAKHEGRVELIRNGVRGTICDDDWDNNDALVICRMLGYSTGYARIKAFFGEGSGVIWLDNVDCAGTEADITDCNLNTWTRNDCEHREDAGVVCQQEETRPVSSASNPFAAITCGLRPIVQRPRARIMGGFMAESGAFPWQAGIREVYNTYGGMATSAHCGATIVSEFWLISAAHCFKNADKSHYIIRVGDLNNKRTDSFEKTFKIQHLLPHELYDSTTHDYDIALIKVKPSADGSGIVVNTHIQPACLPNATTLYRQGQSCWVSGWGKYSSGYPTKLRAAEVPLLGQAPCQRLYRPELSRRMICAGFTAVGIGTCSGDSGGPLVCKVGGKYMLFGVTSWGRDCAEAKYAPGVYAKVQEYLPWLQKQINKYS